MHTIKNHSSPDLRTRDLIPFLVITFLIAWGVFALYGFAPEAATARFGALSGGHPLFYLAVYAPAIAALILIPIRCGIGGIRRFLGRFGFWGLSWRWTVFLVLVTPLPFFLGAMIRGEWSQWNPDAPGVLIPAMLLMFMKGPVEEIGWRGVGLPLLQRKMRPLWAALVLGGVWGFWHLPVFVLSGTPQSTWNFGAFFVGTIALSVIVTALFNQCRGGLWVPVLFHFQMINPLWPDGQPYDTVFFVALAVGVTAIRWRSMWHAEAAVVAVVPNENGTSVASRRKADENRGPADL